MFFSYFELAASLLILVLAFNIYSRHYSNKAARFFGRFALVGFLACLFEYSQRIAPTLEIAQFINRFGSIFWVFTFAMLLHFVLNFTKKDKWLRNNWLLLFFYSPAIILSGIFLFSNLMYKYYEFSHVGIINQPTAWFLLFALHTLFYVGVSISLLFQYSYKSPQRIERLQAMYIALGALIPGLIGLYFDEISPIIFGTRHFWPTAVFDLTVSIFVVFVVMRKYSLFSISPSLAADIIIETMPDSLIITDLDGRVILLNEEAHKYFHVPKEEILGKPICNLFTSKEKYEKLYTEVVDKSMLIERFVADLCDPLGQCIPSIINANKLHDALGATLGVVYIIRDFRG